MAKKLKGLKEKQLSQGVMDSAHQIWLAGLGAFAKTQEEGGKFFDSLVKEGREIENRSKQAANDTVQDIKGKASGTLDRLEQVFEDRVSRALGRLGVPTNDDIQALSKRVEELTESVEALAQAKPATRSRAKIAEEA